MKANAVNLATFANVLCHLNATPLSAAVLAPCAWGGNLACGVARQSIANSATHNTAWRGKIQRHGNKIQRNEFSVASVCGQNKAWRHCKFSTEKMGQCLGGGLLSLSLSLSLSLVARTFWHAFGLNLKGFFTHFVVVSSHLVVNFSYFIAVFPHIFAVTFRFIIVLTHLFACKRHFLGHYAFLKFLNALFLGFCALFVILSLCKKAKNPHKLKDNLPFLDTSLALSMTNSGFCLKTTDKENALCHLKMTADFVILSAAKNPHKLKENLPFLDTSLRSV